MGENRGDIQFATQVKTGVGQGGKKVVPVYRIEMTLKQDFFEFSLKASAIGQPGPGNHRHLQAMDFDAVDDPRAGIRGDHFHVVSTRRQVPCQITHVDFNAADLGQEPVTDEGDFVRFQVLSFCPSIGSRAVSGLS